MLMMFTLGLMIGWTSPYLAQLLAKDSPLPITTDEASWVASLVYLGRLLGAIIGCISVKYFGSKQTLVFIGVPILVCWILIIPANSVIYLYVARIAGGISLGMSISSFPLYLGEVSSPTIRGTLVSLGMSGLASGVLVGSTMGAYISMSTFCYVSIVPNVAFVLLFMWLPESPHYLVLIGRLEDAQKSISRYNPQLNFFKESNSFAEFDTTSVTPSLMDQIREFNLPFNRRAGMIGLALYFFMQFSGLGPITFYTEIIFDSGGLSLVSPATAVIVINVIGVIAGWAAVFIADLFSRKVLMIVSSAGTCISISALGTHFALLNNGFDPETLQWLLLASMIAFQCVTATGLIIVPNMILSELYSPKIKNLAACIASISVGLFGFTASKIYQPLVDLAGEAYVFWMHGILMAVSVIFSAFCLPETKGKSLHEIQNTLMRK